MTPKQHRERRIALPFHIRRHPNEETIQHGVEQWATRRGLLADTRALERFRRHRITSLMTAGCDAADVDLAALVVEVATFAFFLDDQQNNAARTDRATAYDRLNTRLRKVVSGAAVDGEDNPLVRALADLLERLRSRASPDWHARFCHDLTLAFDGHEAENVFRRKAGVPDAEVFPSMRRDASFCYPLFDVLELCHGAPIPSPVHNSRPYRMIREAIADIMCWTNDIHSLHMEQAAGEPINYVTVLQRAAACATDQAVDEVCRRIELRVGELHSARRELSGLLMELSAPRRVREAVSRCVGGFESWAGRMEEWDRTGTDRFDPATIGASGLPSYVEDLLPG
ncbi:terpene synthase family protein [Streptomyces werraensis]|uniref:terpene synthase family protein n=1 Tax=Streptomyces werraensis TaxID=68284 RepID=UPI001CE2545B